MLRILVVEDDLIINQVVTEFLKEKRYEVVSCFDGQEALDCFEKEDFALVILDIMLPSVNGIDVLRKIRESSDVPIMMMTALSDEYTQLVSFNHLISDYVVKPFSPVILMKRVENILRQQKKNSTQTLPSSTDLILDYDNCAVIYKGEVRSLTKKEYDILKFLLNHRGHLVTRDQLMISIWGYSELDSRVLDNHIKNIRKKCQGIPLRTMTGLGYKLEREL